MARPLFVAHFVVSTTACLGTLACSSGSRPSPVGIAPAGQADSPALPMESGRGSGSGGDEASGGEPSGDEASGGGTVSSGAGGSATTVDGGTAVACETAAECDDGLACNGAEQCVANACAASAPIECSSPLSCSEDAGGACVFADDSPWVVYGADDEVPARIDVYAVKRGLIGKMEPVRLNERTEQGTEYYRNGWSPDRRWFSYTAHSSSGDYTEELVYFGAGVPLHVASLPGSSLAWSPSGAAFWVTGSKGLRVYEASPAGAILLVHSGSCTEDCATGGQWSSREELLFTTGVRSSKLRALHRVLRDGTTWKSTPLLKDLAITQLRISPLGTELVYKVEETEGEPGAMYAIPVGSEGAPKLLAPSGASHYVLWNADGSQFLIEKGDATQRVQVFLGTGSVYTGRAAAVEPSYSWTFAYFAPDGKHLLLEESAGDELTDIELLDPTESLSGGGLQWVTRMGNRDPMMWHAGSDAIITVRRDQISDAPRLTAFRLSDPYSVTFDTLSAGETPRLLSLSRKGEFFFYTKGDEATRQGYYVDLRYRELWGYRPVRLPGEGRVNTGEFDTSGTGLYYIREKDSGARELLYLDLSGQVAAEPVKVSRTGRVEFCEPQR